MYRFSTILLALTGLVLGACGVSPNPSSVLLERHDVPTDHITSADTQIFLNHASAIVGSAAHAGTIPVTEFLRLMPMQDNQRQVLASAFPGAFTVNCQAGLCQAAAHGSPAQAVMNVNIDGIVNPSLVLGSTVTTKFVLRGEEAVEFCTTTGLAVKKFFITRQVQGLYLALAGGQPELNVNIDNDRENYTCD